MSRKTRLNKYLFQKFLKISSNSLQLLNKSLKGEFQLRGRGLKVILRLAEGEFDFSLSSFWRILELPPPDNYCTVPYKTKNFEPWKWTAFFGPFMLKFCLFFIFSSWITKTNVEGVSSYSQSGYQTPQYFQKRFSKFIDVIDNRKKSVGFQQW